jgi:predicted RNA-binding Zn ribbon-like protein
MKELTILRVCYRQQMLVDPDLFPIIGEPFPVELANTLYERPGAETDFFADSASIVAWFDLVGGTGVSPLPRRLGTDHAESIRTLRDAMHEILRTSTSQTGLPQGAATALNTLAGAVPCRVRLDITGEPTVSVTPLGRGLAATLTSLAITCVNFVAGPDLALVRRCDGPDCPMFFVPRHHKRRFCYDGCAHRARQARYYRSLHP